MASPLTVKFFHFAGDLQQACRLGKLNTGDTVMFNAGSLLTWRALARSKSKMASYSVMDEVVDALKRYKKRHELRIGLYVQEPVSSFKLPLDHAKRKNC